ncbi:hypothetical protein CNMCM6069_008761 [Aspergillus lentulus]|nr:hypothetical protein CNMCM6069_008761 [Aspergillus lentulus]
MRWQYFLPSVMATISFVNSSFISSLNACPAPCDSLHDSINWTTYDRVDRLSVCNETMLLDFALYNPLESPDTNTKLYACVPDGNPATQAVEKAAASVCPDTNETQVDMEFITFGIERHETVPSAAALKQVQGRLGGTGQCQRSISFGYAQETAMGLYVGGNIEHNSVIESMISKFLDHIRTNGVADRVVLQLCGTDSDSTVGLVVDTTGSLGQVQDVVKQWSDSQCVADYPKTSNWASLSLKFAPTTIQKAKAKRSHMDQHIHRRATCSYIKVVSGDSCGSLASKCGVTGPQFEEYNKRKPNLCSTLAIGQIVCCSPGDLPDLRPKPNPDGTCSSYTVVTDDSCYKISASNGLTIDDLETFNKQTWGWAGCSNLMVGTRMCLSKGNPPMPQAVSNAVCGPQVPGTRTPNDGQKLADLNPCKLNACCNIWGQCGVTAEFCTESQSKTGAPGTAAPGENGCISHCGTDIVNQKRPDHVMQVAYFEAFNYNRPCLNWDVTAVDTSFYTHIHFAFADITTTFEVDISAVELQFNMLKGMTGIKRILSFGGWSFSTEADSYPIFREGVTDANRQTFARNVVDFIVAHGLDGVDFDWEYPGAPDIPGIPPGSKQDGPNYVKFLKMVREILPKDKSLSIAAPASFWYLQGFDPITDFEPLLDYMVYMTYDLHGQWDYDNKWATPGCPKGNCLRSHVNNTETMTAMSMITKAGMPTNKVIMGVASYGRSFKMAQAGCTGPMCPYLGPVSAAAPGRCTETPGYIALAEIREILDQNPTAKTWYDEQSMSDIMVYNETEWVGYMSKDTFALRAFNYVILYGFGGWSDWAVDLKEFYTVPDVTYESCDKTYDTLQAISDDLKNIPDYCVDTYTIPILGKRLQSALNKYNELLKQGYDDKFKTYSEYTEDSVWSQIDEYMMAHGDDHFNCVAQSYVTCCADCGWQGCRDGCDGSCGKGQSGDRNKTVSCPVTRPNTGIGSDGPTIYWQLEDENAFLKDIAEKYGVDPSWITYKPRRASSSQGCKPVDDYKCGFWWFGYPARKDHISVPNPKDVIATAMTNLTIISDMLADAAIEAATLLYVGSTSDVVAASELPVFMTEFAVESMEKIVKAADDIEDAEKKAMILNFVMAFLMIVPAVGEAVGSLGFATIGRIILLTGAAGDTAFGVYGLVDDPKSAIMALFAALVGFRGEMGFAKAAEVRRGMTSKEIAALGSSFKEKSDLLHSIQKVCKA